MTKKYNYINKTGRPTKYLPHFPSEVDKYLATATKENMHLPKVESFASWLGVNKVTVYEWAKIYPDFSNALAKIMTQQAERLIDDGIYGGKEVNPTIIKLLLENNHGMRESQTNIQVNVTPILGDKQTYVPDDNSDK